MVKKFLHEYKDKEYLKRNHMSNEELELNARSNQTSIRSAERTGDFIIQNIISKE